MKLLVVFSLLHESMNLVLPECVSQFKLLYRTEVGIPSTELLQFRRQDCAIGDSTEPLIDKFRLVHLLLSFLRYNYRRFQSLLDLINHSGNIVLPFGDFSRT